MRKEESKTTEEVSVLGAVKNEYLEGWGYTLCTEEAEEAWKVKLAHDLSASKIANPNKPHNRMVDLPGYVSPVTGKWVEGRVARRNDLAASGCVEYDDGMKEAQAKRFAAEDAALDKKVEEHVEKTIYEMPSAKREKLVSEMEHLDVEVTRI